MASIIKENILYPKEVHPKKDITEYGDKSFIDIVLERIKSRLEQEDGDCVWMRNGILSSTGKSTSFGPTHRMLSDVLPMVDKFSRVMYHKYSVGRNDVVSVVLQNSTEFFWPVLSTWVCGGAISPSDPTLRPEVIAQQMKEIDPKIMFCSKSSVESVTKAVEIYGKDTNIVIMDDKTKGPGNIIGLDDFLMDANNLPEVPHEPCVHDDVAVILWSSGSTGIPKGIQYTHGAMLTNWTDHTHFENQSSLLLSTCFFHAGGFATPIIGGLLATKKKVAITFLPPEDLEKGIEQLFQVVADVKPTSLVLGSHHCVQMANAKQPPPDLDLSSVLMITPAGCNVYDGIKDDLKLKFPNLLYVLNMYGQTEISALIGMSFDQKSNGGVGCIVKIRDVDSDETLGPNQVGEIMAKPDVCMKGYRNRPEEDAKFFAGDGWCHTGDLGRFDEDGNLYVEGRLKELIKYKNCHLYPVEIEDIIQKHPDVLEVGVFGKPEPTVQELVTAVVVKAPGSAVTEKDIQEMVELKVDDFKRLRGGVIFVDKLPRNPQGKILRRRLHEVAGNCGSK